MESNEVILLNPHGDTQKASDLAAAIVRRRDEIAKEIDAHPVTKDNWDAPETADEQKALKALVEDLRDKGKAFVKAVIEDAGALAIVTAIDPRLLTHVNNPKGDAGEAYKKSAYGALSARLKERADLIAEYKAASLHEKPERWTFGVKLLPSQKRKIEAAIERAGGTLEYAEIVKPAKKGTK